MGPLAQELAARLASFRQNAPVAVQEAFTAQIEELRATGIEDRVLPVGAELPDLVLPDASGTPRRLREFGPAVLVFYRGGWCPYCNLQLRAWQQRLAELSARGLALVAISPQQPDASLDTAEKNALAFPVLSDSAGLAGAAFGVSFTLPEALADIYRGFGNDLAVLNGPAGWRLPVPATFVVGADGRIVFAKADADYRTRVEPDEALAALGWSA